MDRTYTIIHAIQKHGYKSYLELGCRHNATFNCINVPHKIGVDSTEGGTHRMTTDDFFIQNTEKFDIVFIDAFHHHDQVLKDFNSSLAILNPGGLIVLHDCNPCNLLHEAQDGCGTAWRTFVTRIRTDTELDSIVGDYDHGVGIVRVAKNVEPLDPIGKTMDELVFDDLVQNRSSWLRLRSKEDVMKWL